MKRTLVLFLLAMAMQVQATFIEYREGSWQVPDEMRELSAEQIKEAWPELMGQMEQVRAFMQDSRDKRGIIVAIGGVRPAPETLRSFSQLRDVEKIKKGAQEEVGNEAMLTGAEIDSANQKIILSASTQQNGVDFKMRLFAVPVKDNKILTTKVDSGDPIRTLARVATSLFLAAASATWAFYRRKKSRRLILWVSILSVLIPPLWVLAILWAILGGVESRE